jgi:predicted dehydrogenase
VPENVDPKDAAFATVGAIALNGVRQAQATIGDSVLVVGLGLVGLLAVQILKAAGCRVLGVDLDERKLELARECGAEIALHRNEPGIEDTIRCATNGLGPDVVYLAAATASSDPMDLAGKAVRDRGRVVIVGMVKVEADWQTYYHKEISVVMARSYGPGRYDRNYEWRGIDYPIGYVRWTLRRNMEEFLRLISSGHVQPSRLSPGVFSIERAPEAYDELHENPGKHAVGILFEYPRESSRGRRIELRRSTNASGNFSGQIGIGLIGAGNFATGTLIPAIKQATGVRLRGICSAGGLSARSAAGRHGFEYCTSDYAHLLDDELIQAVVIATRHDTHAAIAAEALQAGKHAFVEKPLALNREQLERLSEAQAQANALIMPGFNRRFSPLSESIRRFFNPRSGPIQILIRVNAGALKADSWYRDDAEGGWRIISEGCHFLDLMQFLCGAAITEVSAEMIGGHIEGEQKDNCSVCVRTDDGSLGTLVYTAGGDPCFEKERIEVFGQGRTAVIENWRVARLWASGKQRKVKAGGTGKGHALEMAAFIQAVREGGPSPIPFHQAIAATLATFKAAACMAAGRMETIGV